MVNVEKSVEILLKKFERRTEYEDRKIVFWYDREHTAWNEKEQRPAEELEEIMEKLKENNISSHIYNDNAFETKKLLEVEDSDSDYLVYTPYPETRPEKNWLLDIQLYSGRYESTRLGDLKSELDIVGYRLDDFFEKHMDFFANKRRVARFKRKFEPKWTDRECFLGVLAVISRSDNLDTMEILRNILMESLEEENNRAWDRIVKYGLAERFWKLMSPTFGHRGKDSYLKKLFLSFVMTHIKQKCGLKIKGYTRYLNSNPNECEIFLQRWLNHSKDSSAYDETVERLLRENDRKIEMDINAAMKEANIEHILDAESVDIIDKTVIRKIISELTSGNENYDDYLGWIEKRKTKHWYGKFEDHYNALTAAVELFRFDKEFQPSELEKMGPSDLFKAYRDKFYKMDYYYRRFYYNYDRQSDREILKKRMRGEVENLYTNNLAEVLSDRWSRVLNEELEPEWSIGLIDRQDEFFSTYVEPVLRKNDTNRVAVIISDALRYEAAEELMDELDSETKGTMELNAMAGVVPSDTKLGMAALLPYETLAYEKGKILADGKSTEGLANRLKALERYEEDSLAIKLNDFLRMERSELRKWVKGSRVLYIYHDSIDATGDDPKTEHNVFKAVRDAVEDITKCVKRLGHGLSYANILITADHGFLYQRDPLKNVDKKDVSAFDKKDRVELGKRYLLSRKKVELENSHKFDVSHLRKDSGDLFVYVPRTHLRFKSQGGGINFVHGGTALQEITVPVLKYSHVRQDIDLERKGIKHGKVGLVVLNQTRKITSTPFVIKLFQTHKVTEKMEPLKCKVALWDLDAEEKKVSEEKKIIADSSSDNPAERQQRITLTISKNIENKVYYIRIIDTDPKAIKKDVIDPIPFNVNIMIIDDF